VSETNKVETGTSPIGPVFYRRVEELGGRIFIKLQCHDRFAEISWQEFGALVAKTLLGLCAVGLSKGDMVGIVAENCLEWLCADVATLAAGFANVVASPRLSDGSLVKILGHSRARLAFVENEAVFARLARLRAQLPELEHLVVMDESSGQLSDALSFKALVQLGEDNSRMRIDEVVAAVREDDLATVIYTSGSTGAPKGVMRTHGNVMANITNGGAVSMSKPEDLVVLVLSLNHLLGRFGFHKSVVTGRTTALVEATELLVNLEAIQRLAPTSMSLVPRVLDKICTAIFTDTGLIESWAELESLDQQKGPQGALGEAGKTRYAYLRRTLREAAKQALGGRLKYISYAGAAMPPRLIRLFELIEVPLLGSYGSTECGGVTLSGIGERRPGNLGKPFRNVELRIAEDGEILVRGPTVTPGYFKNPPATEQALDAQGWFHTGDLGALETDGSLRMIGRKTDLFYCIDGSNIAPGQIELLLESDSFIRQAVLLGDCRPFIACLLVPDRARIEEQAGVSNEAEIERFLWSRVVQINERLEEHEKIRRIVILDSDFPASVRSVTTLEKIKIDRKKVEEVYARAITEIYETF
jgi:long-chain acyl-CoA synthetase